MAKPKAPLEVRFKQKYQIQPDGCWLWIAFRLPRRDGSPGYGYLGLGGRGDGRDYAHRVSYRLHRGEIPPKMHVLHKCDNPGCVNPDHLFLGTPKDNMDDMASKGRRGKTGPKKFVHLKLTPEQVEQIKAHAANGVPGVHLAIMYKVGATTISRALADRYFPKA